ncbi:alanine racemase [Qiania dongpingensis]|uniref:Alanine racemase n=1 Tax=Qiania dongpingensis TaxID=2763669 RepID=A0A7G9G426_9FIRM|nr:alanine racemase [Qiania dongpingensis]QNM05558.1 alanine racemase [Qiania dongpingensis]
MKEYSRTAAWIDLDAIYGNVKALKENTRKGTRICAVIKADGYGHGAVPIARKLKGLADYFAVATAEEAFNLRYHQIEEPILVLGYVPEDAYERAVMEEIRLTVYTYEMAERLSEAAKRCGKQAFIHIKLETGMNRIGFRPGEEALSQAEAMSRLPGIMLEGIFSHFARADEKDKSYAERQYRIFDGFVSALKKRGVEIPLKHMGNSAAIIDLPQFDVDMVRAGIALYGMYPSNEVDRRRVGLTPALRLTARVIFIKEIEPGETVGYGGTYTAQRRMKIATIPIGYGDGYPRNLSNRGYVLLDGKKAPITGRVCMDQLMVDVTDVPEVRQGDEAVLVGRDGEQMISVEELAELAGTFNYEFVCDLGKRIPRIYLDGGKIVGKKDYFTDPYEIVL